MAKQLLTTIESCINCPYRLSLGDNLICKIYLEDKIRACASFIAGDATNLQILFCSYEYVPVECPLEEADVEPGSHLEAQIEKLAEFIMREVDDEPSQDEGAVDCAIRIIESERIKNGQLPEEEWIDVDRPRRIVKRRTQ